MLPGTEEHLPKDVTSREHKRLTEETDGSMRDVIFWFVIASVTMVGLLVLVTGLKHFFK